MAKKTKKIEPEVEQEEIKHDDVLIEKTTEEVIDESQTNSDNDPYGVTQEGPLDPVKLDYIEQMVQKGHITDIEDHLLIGCDLGIVEMIKSSFENLENSYIKKVEELEKSLSENMAPKPEKEFGESEKVVESRKINQQLSKFKEELKSLGSVAEKIFKSL